MLDRLLRTEPVRLYSICTAAAALAAYFLPSGAWPLVLGLAAAILGVGRATRAQVWSQASHDLALDQLVRITAAMPDPDDEPAAGDRGAVSWGTVALMVMAVVTVLWAIGEVPR